MTLNTITRRTAHTGPCSWRKKAAISLLATACVSNAFAAEIVGNDLNVVESDSSETSEALRAIFSANAGSAGGGDQSLQAGDILIGTAESDQIYGVRGNDTLLGGAGDDTLIGGPENGRLPNQDRLFGQAGNDLAVWKPGDGNDYFDGGEGQDVLFIHIDESFGLEPILNTTSPCQIITSEAAFEAEFAALNVDHAIVLDYTDAYFDLLGNIDGREAANAIYLRDVEFLVCARTNLTNFGSDVSIYRLDVSPAEEANIDDLPLIGRQRIRQLEASQRAL